MRSLFIFVFSIFIAAPLSFGAEVTCKRLLFDDQSRTESVPPVISKNLNTFGQIFTRDRGLSSYIRAFGDQFNQALNKVSSQNGTWLDSGSGDAIAVQEFLELRESNQARATALALESTATNSPRLLVLKGRYLEEIPDAEIPKSNLITDVFGPLAYSGSPHLVLKKYFQNLVANGEILIFLGSRTEIYGQKNRIITHDGQYLTLADWIKQIPGIKSELTIEQYNDEGTVLEKWALKLSRDPNKDLLIPELKLKNFTPGAPPTMIFEESNVKLNELSQRLQEMKEQLRPIIQDRIQKVTFTDFMNSFRSGEFTHPLIKEIKGLSADETWINSSDFGADLVDNILSKSFDPSSTKTFISWAQKWIQFRLNSVDPRQFRYLNVTSTKDILPEIKASLITDFYGDFISEISPSQILTKYLNSLKEEGSLFIFLGGETTGFGTTSEVLTRSGKKLSLRKWLQSLDGLDVSFYRGGYAYMEGEWNFVKIKKTKESANIPNLKFLGSENQFTGEIPKMIFIEE